MKKALEIDSADLNVAISYVVLCGRHLSFTDVSLLISDTQKSFPGSYKLMSLRAGYTNQITMEYHDRYYCRANWAWAIEYLLF